MLDIICWKWAKPGYRSAFGPETVNTLRAMAARHYRKPHRFSCITDDPAGIDGDVRIIPLWDDFKDLPNLSIKNGPSCYRRLRAFAPEMADVIGPRFVSLDLDMVIVGDVAPIWDRPEDFVIWGGTCPYATYNGSMFLMNAGARRQVWERFDPATSPGLAHAAGERGSDQGWIGYCLGKNEARWTTRDGVYSWRVHLLEGRRRIPPNARIVSFHGRHNPWGPEAQRMPWVREHYR